METDLKKIQEYGLKREKENMRFRTFLKGQNSKRIDRIVHGLNTEISNKIDCTLCANCCGKLRPKIENKDLEKLGIATGMDEKNITEEYLEKEKGEFYFKSLPCRFLEQKKCSIYASRPSECESYPHLHKPSFIFRLWTVLNNYDICPIVYNVVEQLKEQTKFRR